MALQCVCAKGHTYIQADKHLDWSGNDDVPKCPECLAEWLELRVSEGKIRMAGDGVTIQVYVDEHGIGIFDETWDDDCGPTDLRIDDMDSFLTFVHALLVAGKEVGWFKKTTARYTLK